jgi:hypothetical protein
MPYAVSVTSLMPPGEHTITASVECPKGHVLPEKTFKLKIDNPFYGKVPPDEDVEDLKKQHGADNVSLLQQGQAVKELNLPQYYGCKDTYLYSGNPVADRNMDFINFGGSPELGVGHYAMESRTLIKFDLSAIPKTATMQKVLLKLQLQTGAALDLPAYRVLKAWQQGIGIGDLYDKQKGRIRDGECSWLKRVHPDSAWGAPGCGKAGEDYEAKAVPSVCAEAKNAAQKLEKVWVSWDLTEFAQGWVKDPASNNGVVLIGSDKNPRSAFRSSDFEDPIYRPKLIVVFKK